MESLDPEQERFANAGIKFGNDRITASLNLGYDVEKTFLLCFIYRMEPSVRMVTVFILGLLATTAQGVHKWDSGKGLIYRLGVVQDVWLENIYRNTNNYPFFLVAKVPQFPNKRSLIQFEDLPRRCSSARIQYANMYLYFLFTHKASWHTITSVPAIPRHLEVRLVNKAWKESQATRSRRLHGRRWSSPWLRLDGTDAEAVPQRGKVTIFPFRRQGFVEFDITDAVKSWRSGVPNHGLLIRATNELAQGRGLAFASNNNPDRSKHAFVLVRCV